MKFAVHCDKWVKEQGVSIIGGCCRISPSMIKMMVDKLNNVSHKPLAVDTKLKATRETTNQPAAGPMSPFWANKEKTKLAKL